MYMVVLWCGRRKSGKTPPFSPIFQPICMQICPLHIITEGKASKHAQSKLLIVYPFYLVFAWFLPEKHFGPLLCSYTCITPYPTPCSLLAHAQPDTHEYGCATLLSLHPACLSFKHSLGLAYSYHMHKHKSQENRKTASIAGGNHSRASAVCSFALPNPCGHCPQAD